MVRPLDLIGKTLVNSFIYTNIFEDKSVAFPVTILGREYMMTGENCPCTIVGNIYAYGPNVEPDNFLLLLGASDNGKIEVAVEAAAMNANLDPIYVIKGDDPNINTEEYFKSACFTYINSQRKKLVATSEEKEKYNADIITV